MIRVVVDPNVLISALIGPSGSAPHQVVMAWQAGLIEFVVSPLLLRELQDVLRRPKFARFQAQVGPYVAMIESDALLVEDPSDPPGTTADPGDDYLVALARAGAADAIVSGDRHLLEIDGLVPPALSPRTLLDRLSTA